MSAWRKRFAFVFVLSLALLLAALATLLAVSRSSVPPLLATNEQPVTAGIASEPLDYGADVTLRLEVGDHGEIVTPPGLAGTVTAIHVTPGTEVAEGQPIVSVDGVQVLAYIGDVVFYRPLATGSTGPDVQRLQQMLRGLWGYEIADADGYFGWMTRSAVKDLAGRIGANADGIFQPSWLARLPTSPVAIVKIEAVLGTPAPAPGSPLASTPRQVSEIEAIGASDGPAGDYQFRSPAGTITLVREDDGWQLQDLTGVEELLVDAPTDGSAIEVEGYLALATAESGLTVVPAAIVAESGNDCIYVEAEEGRYRPIPVKLLGSTFGGRLLISGEVQAGQQVVVNPQTISARPTCPSN